MDPRLTEIICGSGTKQQKIRCWNETINPNNIDGITGWLNVAYVISNSGFLNLDFLELRDFEEAKSTEEIATSVRYSHDFSVLDLPAENGKFHYQVTIPDYAINMSGLFPIDCFLVRIDSYDENDRRTYIQYMYYWNERVNEFDLSTGLVEFPKLVIRVSNPDSIGTENDSSSFIVRCRWSESEFKDLEGEYASSFCAFLRKIKKGRRKRIRR